MTFEILVSPEQLNPKGLFLDTKKSYQSALDFAKSGMLTAAAKSALCAGTDARVANAESRCGRGIMDDDFRKAIFRSYRTGEATSIWRLPGNDIDEPVLGVIRAARKARWLFRDVYVQTYRPLERMKFTDPVYMLIAAIGDHVFVLAQWSKAIIPTKHELIEQLAERAAVPYTTRALRVPTLRELTSAVMTGLSGLILFMVVMVFFAFLSHSSGNLPTAHNVFTSSAYQITCSIFGSDCKP